MIAMDDGEEIEVCHHGAEVSDEELITIMLRVPYWQSKSDFVKAMKYKYSITHRPGRETLPFKKV
jgi:hypothetical protein